MPTVLKQGSYRLFFYASDRGEPPHVQVERENRVAKIWLNPLRLAHSGDFGRAEIRLDEDLSVEGLIAGRASGESQASLARWIEARH